MAAARVAAAVGMAGPIDADVLRLARSELGEPLGSSDSNAQVESKQQKEGATKAKWLLELVPTVVNAMARDARACEEPTKLELLKMCARALMRIDPDSIKLKAKSRWTIHKYAFIRL